MVQTSINDARPINNAEPSHTARPSYRLPPYGRFTFYIHGYAGFNTDQWRLSNSCCDSCTQTKMSGRKRTILSPSPYRFRLSQSRIRLFQACNIVARCIIPSAAGMHAPFEIMARCISKFLWCHPLLFDMMRISIYSMKSSVDGLYEVISGFHKLHIIGYDDQYPYPSYRALQVVFLSMVDIFSSCCCAVMLQYRQNLH